MKNSKYCEALGVTLAAMAIQGCNLEIAEHAYAALNRLERVLTAKQIGGVVERDAWEAEIALLCGNLREAKLLNSGFLLRAIVANLEAYQWHRALEMATKYDNSGRYLKIIALQRRRYLIRYDKNEDLKFKKLSN